MQRFAPAAYVPRLDGGSPIPEENSMLATAIRRAKDSGVPKENIENALLKVRLMHTSLTRSLVENGAGFYFIYLFL